MEVTFSVATGFTVSTGKSEHPRGMPLDHTHPRYKQADGGSNIILECKILFENEHRTFGPHSFSIKKAVLASNNRLVPTPTINAEVVKLSAHGQRVPCSTGEWHKGVGGWVNMDCCRG
jgi:hypothetical protein